MCQGIFLFSTCTVCSVAQTSEIWFQLRFVFHAATKAQEGWSGPGDATPSCQVQTRAAGNPFLLGLTRWTNSIPHISPGFSQLQGQVCLSFMGKGTYQGERQARRAIPVNFKAIWAAFYPLVAENVSRMMADQVISHHRAKNELSGCYCSRFPMTAAPPFRAAKKFLLHAWKRINAMKNMSVFPLKKRRLHL